jgi:hypothetical protein
MRRRGAGQSGAATRVTEVGFSGGAMAAGCDSTHRSLDGIRASPRGPECPADLRGLGRVGELGIDDLGHKWELEDSV